MRTNTRTTTPSNESKGDLIPRKVVKAIDATREAVEQHALSSNHLLRAVVQLFVTCRQEEYNLKGTQAAEMTGASAAYISRVWKATEAYMERPRARPLLQAEKLGFRGYLESYSPPPRAYKKKGPTKLETIQHATQDSLADLAEQVRDRTRVELALVENDQRARLLAYLEEAASLVRQAVLTPPAARVDKPVPNMQH